MFGNVLLALWTTAGLAWWIISCWLVATARAPKIASEGARRSVTIFKPLPPLGPDGMRPFVRGLGSFAAQLGEGSEMLLGIHEMDRGQAASFVRELLGKFPRAAIRVIHRSVPDDAANPKIAWQKILAPHATGELWLWSDADIVAPSGFLDQARAGFGRRGEGMMTFPYVVRAIPQPPAVLEALFVNADFYPGVLLLRRTGPVDFGLGAAMLFRRDDFLRRVGWREVGAALADDFHLGQKLGPVRIGAATLETIPSSCTWPDALAHDFRWWKTIRWNRPGGMFSRIVTMPVFGWIAAVALHPAQLAAWLGLAGMVQADACFAMLLAHLAGCRAISRQWVACELWSFWRATLWVASWLPGRVTWSGRAWREPRVEINSHEEARVGTH